MNDPDTRWTRGRLLRGVIAAGAVVVGGAGMGTRPETGTSAAARSAKADAEILNFFLLLEYVQQGFYSAAIENGRLDGDLLEFAQTVGRQEAEHVSFLTDRLGSRARQRPRLDFKDAVVTPEQFRAAAIDLEEAALAGYIGQGANLSRNAVTSVATLVSVEARQAAWVRDLAGVSPAPDAADPARPADRVVEDLRRWEYIA